MTTPAIALPSVDRAQRVATGKAVTSPGKVTEAGEAEFAATLAVVERVPQDATTDASTATALGVATGEEKLVRPLVAHEARKAPPLEKFEGFVLRSFVESMLPSSESSYFGKGTAGEIWRSMLAEQIGNEMAKNGGIGIAASISGKKGSRFGGLAASSSPSSPAASGPSIAPQSRAAVDGLNAMLRAGDLARTASADGADR